MPGKSLIGSIASLSGWYKAAMLVLAVLAVVLTITLTRSPHRDLELRLESRTPLFSEDVRQTGFQVLFDGRPVENATKFAFALLNSGSEHISDSDVREPVAISFGSNAEVFLIQQVGSNPPDLMLHFGGIGSSDASVQFTLMNPGDFARFCVYVSGAAVPSPAATGRIAGVKMIRLVDKTNEPISPPRRATAGQWVLWVLAAIGLLGLVGLWGEVRGQRELKWLIARDPEYLRRVLTSPHEVELFIESKLAFLTTKEKAELRGNAREEGQDVSEQLLERIHALIMTSSASKGGMLVSAMLALPGLVALVLFLAG